MLLCLHNVFKTRGFSDVFNSNQRHYNNTDYLLMQVYSNENWDTTGISAPAVTNTAPFQPNHGFIASTKLLSIVTIMFYCYPTEQQATCLKDQSIIPLCWKRAAESRSVSSSSTVSDTTASFSLILILSFRHQNKRKKKGWGGVKCRLWRNKL